MDMGPQGKGGGVECGFAYLPSQLSCSIAFWEGWCSGAGEGGGLVAVAFWAPSGAKCFGLVFFQHAEVYSPAYCRFIKPE